MDKTLSGDTLPVMTGTDKTTVEPGIPTMQPSFSPMSGTWSDSFIPAKDKTSTFAPISSMPAKDPIPTSVPAKDQTSTSTSAPTGYQTTSLSVPAKDLNTILSATAEGQTEITFLSANGQTTRFSIPAKGQSTTSSVLAKDRSITSLVTIKDQTESSSAVVKDQSTSLSMPAGDQPSTSVLGTDHAASSSVPAEDQTTKPSNPAKDLTSSTSNQVYGFSSPTSAKNEKTYSKSQTSASSGKLIGSASSTVPVVVTYSFTMPPSSSIGPGKSETSLSVVISSFTVPSVIYSFTVQSSRPETVASTSSVGTIQAKSEKSDSTTKSGQLPGTKGSSSRIGKPYYTATSSMVPLWTPDMLGNAYGGGFVNTPSIYVTLSPNPTATATGVPPGYGFTVKPEISDKSSSPYSGFLGMSNGKIRLGGSPTQTIPVSGFGPSYVTDEYGIPTSGISSTTGSTDCCSASTTFSAGQIDNFGIPVSVPESYPTSYTFSEMYPTPITTAPYRNNATLPAENGSSNSNGALMNPTALPEFRGFAVKDTIGLNVGILGILVFVLLI